MIFVHSSAFSQVEKAQDYPEQITLSYINHPAIVEIILPLIKQTYMRLGIDVEFVEQPSARNLRLASKGVTDGDAAYSDLLVDFYDNLLIVGPGLVQSQFILVCHISAECNAAILEDSTKTIVLTDASRDGLKYKYKDQLKSELYSINRLSRIPKLIDDRRLVYGIYVVAKLDNALAEYPNLTYEHLFTTNTHHILNKKFEFMADDVAAAMQQVIREQGLIPTTN